MFFYRGINCPIKGLERVEPDLYLDQGWKTHDVNGLKVYAKGYSTECNLESAIYKIVLDGYRPVGKWCIITSDKIIHPVMRGYPIFKIGSDLTNIPELGGERIASDETKILNSDPITLESASVLIGNILVENTVNFLKYQDIEKLNVLFSMGLDSLTVWAVVDYLIDWYDLNIYVPGMGKPNDPMGTVREYSSDLLNHLSKHCWGYKMTSVFKETNYYTTGFYSERIQLREVTNGHAIAKFYKTQLHRMVRKEDYLYHFLQRPECKKNTCEIEFQDEIECKNYCYNSIFHDYQMWHIDNNFHFSPFYDQRIAEICYRMSLEDIVKNAANGLIQKKIIEKYNPELLCLLANYKNHGPIHANFLKNWHKIKLSSSVNINIT